jgi:ubiquinone biosynthesis protein COQ4
MFINRIVTINKFVDKGIGMNLQFKVIVRIKIMTMETKTKAPRRNYIAAWKALRALMRDREDTTQVFKIMQALVGDALEKQYARFLATDIGPNIIANKINLLDTLKDREALAKLPEGSLGREYLNFMIAENITAEGLVDASDDSFSHFQDENLERYAMRTREMHDLWHVITGYGRDGLGEFCVVAFSYSQTKSLGFAAIALMGAADLSRKFKGHGVFGAVMQAFKNGRKAAWLPGQDWENLMAVPLSEIRSMMNIIEPSKYNAASEVSAQTRPDPIPATV